MPPGPPGGTGAATHPSPMAGSAAQGMTAVKVALEALQKALPSLPLGSDIHGAALKAVTELSKHMNQDAGGGSGAMVQQLVQMARQAKEQPQQAAMMGMFPGGGAGAGPGAGPGAPPGPGGPPPGP